MRKFITKTSVASALVAAATATAVAAGQETTNGPSAAPASALSAPAESPFGGTKTEITAVASDQRSEFAVLRRAQTAADNVPSQLRTLLGETDITGKNLDLARAVTFSKGTAYVIPGSGTLCIALPDPLSTVGLACSDEKTAVSEGTFGAITDPKNPDTSIVGLVLPDGATATAVYADHEEGLVPASPGVVVTSLTGATAVRVDGPNGTATHPLMPADLPILDSK